MKSARLINEVSNDEVEVMIVKKDAGWVVIFPSGRMLNPMNDEQVKEFLNKVLHADHDGADFADDGCHYKLIRSLANDYR